MSEVRDIETGLTVLLTEGISPRRFAGFAVALGILGVSTIWFTLVSLWGLWTTDALKSIGIVVPFVSLLLILRVWRSLGWQAEGTWWGLGLLVMVAMLARLQERTTAILVVSPHWSTILLPPSLMLFAYGSGAVLLLGGVRLYRAALFPIILLCFANPIPHVFTALVDLPLQRASAHVARAFAMGLGQQLTPDRIRIMFTPDFGMFIAPGCNGIRGSVTMGFIALIAGYLYRFRWYVHALLVIGGILVGYVFNLVRLCLLVLYYAVALHLPSLQNKAEAADYLIGAGLFLVAAGLLMTALHRFRDPYVPSMLRADSNEEQGKPLRHLRYAQLAAMGTIALLGCTELGRAHDLLKASKLSASEEQPNKFPSRVGTYTLIRTWNESNVGGTILYTWAQYSPAGGGTAIAIGISPLPGYHDPVLCHTVRGESPIWQGQLTVATGSPESTSFSSAFYNDGLTRHMEASTMCSGGKCGEFTTGRAHFGLVYTRPDPRSLFGLNDQIPIRVLLRIETIDATASNDAALQKLTQDVKDFLADVRLADLTQQQGRP